MKEHLLRGGCEKGPREQGERSRPIARVIEMLMQGDVAPCRTTLSAHGERGIDACGE